MSSLGAQSQPTVLMEVNGMTGGDVSHSLQSDRGKSQKVHPFPLNKFLLPWYLDLLLRKIKFYLKF